MLDILERAKILWAAQPKSYSGAAMAAKYVSLKLYGMCYIVIQTGAWAAGTAAVTLLQATKVDASGAKALAFDYQWNDVATSGALVKTAVTSNTFNLDTADKLYVIPVDPRSLDVAGGFDCVTAAIASPGANVDLYGVTYILTHGRDTGVTPASPLVD